MRKNVVWCICNVFRSDYEQQKGGHEELELPVLFFPAKCISSTPPNGIIDFVQYSFINH